MINKRNIEAMVIFTVVVISCKTKDVVRKDENSAQGKVIIYQVFTRLFGNKNTTNKPWGTLEENGVGKFNDFTDKALLEIKDLGVNYIWYTGSSSSYIKKIQLS